jgi:DNA-binding transcriptional ArsR family regulator
MAHSKAPRFDSPYDINYVASKYGKVIGYPARLIIMYWLAAMGPKHAHEISDYIELSKATTSHHLAKLEGAGLITGDEKGPYIRYSLSKEGFIAMRFFISRILQDIADAAGIDDEIPR